MQEMKLMQVLLVMHVMHVSQVMQISLAHLWVDFRVILTFPYDLMPSLKSSVVFILPGTWKGHVWFNSYYNQGIVLSQPFSDEKKMKQSNHDYN